MPRPFSTETALGEALLDQGWTATEFSHASGIHPRTLTEYLAGRSRMSGRHLAAAADVLEIKAEDLVDDLFV